MTDEELIARLRSMHWCVTTKANGVGVSDEAVAPEAADRIEALIAENAKLHDHIEGVAKGIHKVMVGYEAKLAKAEAGLIAIAKRDEQMIWGEDYEVEEAFKDMRDIALATLADIQGESHD